MVRMAYVIFFLPQNLCSASDSGNETPVLSNKNTQAEGRMSYWLRAHSGSRNNCFSKIQLVGQKYRDKTT